MVIETPISFIDLTRWLPEKTVLNPVKAKGSNHIFVCMSHPFRRCYMACRSQSEYFVSLNNNNNNNNNNSAHSEDTRLQFLQHSVNSPVLRSSILFSTLCQCLSVDVRNEI
jgi:tRNA(Arg) A34 adenosine deaminase TadA